MKRNLEKLKVVFESSTEIRIDYVEIISGEKINFLRPLGGGEERRGDSIYLSAFLHFSNFFFFLYLFFRFPLSSLCASIRSIGCDFQSDKLKIKALMHSVFRLGSKNVSLSKTSLHFWVHSPILTFSSGPFLIFGFIFNKIRHFFSLHFFN